jgi:hypothetical protein
VPAVDGDLHGRVAGPSGHRHAHVVVGRGTHFVVAGVQVDIHLAAADERLVVALGLRMSDRGRDERASENDHGNRV